MKLIQAWLSLAITICAPLSVPAAELNRYLPDDTEVVVGLDVPSILGSALVQKQVPAVLQKHGAGLLRLVEASGAKIDEGLRKEMLKQLADAAAVRKWLSDHKTVFRRVLIASNADFDDSTFVMVFEGDFDREKTKAFFKLLAETPLGVVVKPMKEGKHEFWSLKTVGDEDEMLVALADEKNMVACLEKETLLKTLARADRKGGKVHKELVETAAKVDPKAAVWLAAAPKETEKYVAAYGSVRIDDGIKIATTIVTKDAEGAKKLADELKNETIKDAVDDLDDAAKTIPALGAFRDILKTVEPRSAQNVVTVEVELPGPAIDGLIKDLPPSK